MDRQSHAEVGGPYSNQADAERAINKGNFSGNKADLVIQEGETDDDEDTGSSKEALRTQAAMPGQVSEQAPVGANPSIPPLGQPKPDMAPQVPQTTKPSQVPGDGGGGPSPVSPGGEMPQDFTSQQFQNPDTFTGDTPGNDAVSTAIASVTAQVRKNNPEVDEPTARRVARQVVGKLVEAGANLHMVHIEDPLANKTPLQVLKGIQPKKPQQSQSPGDGGPRLVPGRHPEDEDESPGLRLHDDDNGGLGGPRPSRTPEFDWGTGPADAAGGEAGAAAAGEGAAGAAALGEGAAGLGELAPLLLL